MAQPRKVYKLNYWKSDLDLAASLVIEGSPSSIKIKSSNDHFVAVSDNGITLSPGIGKSINVQGMSSTFKYGGLLQNLPFPSSIIPITTFTPLPTQTFVLPLAQLLPTIRDMNLIASSFVGL